MLSFDPNVARMPRMTDDGEILRRRYEALGATGDDNTTACDYNLRDLEIQLALEYIREGDVILDVGCGTGVALRRYATDRQVTAYGIDYARSMVGLASRRVAEEAPRASISIQQASATELPFDSESFDVVTSHRCLMALLDWERQKDALRGIHRVLKPVVCWC